MLVFFFSTVYADEYVEDVKTITATITQAPESADDELAEGYEEVQDYDDKKTYPLEGEVKLMIDEYRDIVRLYKSAGRDVVNTYRRLLARLNKMNVNTRFLAGQRDILKNSIRFSLNIDGTANAELDGLIQSSPYPSIVDDAFETSVSHNYTAKNIAQLENMLEMHNNVLNSKQKSFLDIIIRSFGGDISTKEASVLLEEILSPNSIYQNKNYRMRLLYNIQDRLSTVDIAKAINTSFYNCNLATAIALIRIQVKNSFVDAYTLDSWDSQLKTYRSELLSILKQNQEKSEIYQNFIEGYYTDRAAKNRGRVYHKQLYAYRGMGSAAYNVDGAKRILDKYLDGDVEAEFLEENAKRAFRSFLAFKDYDTLVEYAVKMREKMDGKVSPYISFWGAYGLLKNGSTNDAIPLLGEIVYTDPEGYFGILAQKKLKYIFDNTAFAYSRYVNGLKSKSSLNRKYLLEYAHIMYYMGNRSAKNRAEKIFVDEGLAMKPGKVKLNPEFDDLVHAYLQLSLDIRPMLHSEGLQSVYDQDVVLFDLYNQSDDVESITKLVNKGYSIMRTKKSFSLSSEAMQVYYPRPYQREVAEALKHDENMDMYLIYSVMRSESFYKEKARSKAGARGLMQVMPATGEWLMGRWLPKVKSYSLYDTSLNVYLGARYLYENIDQLGMLTAIAAYNSGPNYMKNLIKKYEPNTDLELMEIHPKNETRNYIHKVIESYEYYSIIYGNKAIEYRQS